MAWVGLGRRFGATYGRQAPPVRRDDNIELIEERLVGKREVNRGGVRVQSYVTETPVNEQVDLSRF